MRIVTFKCICVYNSYLDMGTLSTSNAALNSMQGISQTEKC